MSSSKKDRDPFELAFLVSEEGRPEDFRQLENLLREDPQSRSVVRHVMEMRAHLHWQLAEPSLRSIIPDSLTPEAEAEEPVRQLRQRWRPVGLAALAAVACGLLIVWMLQPPVARLQLSPSAVLSTYSPAQFGQNVKAGQFVELIDGVAQIEFRNGARITSIGPGSLRVESPTSVYLERGALAATISPAAHGFQVRTPQGTVVDLGTQFSVVVDAQRQVSDVHVHEGRVELHPASAPQTGAVVLTSGESRRMQNGISNEISHLAGLYPWVTDYESLLKAAAPQIRWSPRQSDSALVRNMVGDHSHLTLVGDVQMQPGGTGAVLEFPRTYGEAYLWLNEPIEPILGNEFTVELAVRPSSDRQATLLATKHRQPLKPRAGSQHPPHDSFMIEFGRRGVPNFTKEPANCIRVVYRQNPSNTGPVSLFSESDIPIQEWSHLVVTRNRGTLQIWINGQLSGSARIPDAPLPQHDYVILGDLVGKQDFAVANNSIRQLHGALNECMIYSRALTPREIQEHAATFRAQVKDY